MIDFLFFKIKRENKLRINMSNDNCVNIIDCHINPMSCFDHVTVAFSVPVAFYPVTVSDKDQFRFLLSV